MYGYIIQALVEAMIKVSGYLTLRVILGDFQKMRREAHFQFTLSLADILNATPLTSDTVDKV